MRVTDLTGEQIERARLGEDLFEAFVESVLRDELARRHPASQLHPGGKTKARDGGRDLVLEVTQAPSPGRAEFEHALTGDEVGVTFYSCKSGHTWSRAVDHDFRMPAVRNARTKGPPGEQAKRPAQDLLHHVGAGGRYVVVVDQRVDHARKNKFVADAVEAFERWLPDGGLALPSGLADQFALLDANQVAAYLAHHRARLPAKLREALGLRDAEGLVSWEQWVNEFEHERGIPPFVPDDERERLMALIGAATGTNRVIRIVGSPGVGKTRVAYQALASLPNPSATVLYTSSPDHGHRAIEGGWLAGTRNVVLVVDEVRSSDVDRAAPRFAANATDSLLLLVGTPDADAVDMRQRGVELQELARLDSRASRRLIANSLGVEPSSPDPRLDSVFRLAEGYPLFMVLLAQALAEDRDALVAGRDETSRWVAAKRVIAGPKRDYGHDHSRWDEEALVRAKCLLVAILTGDLDLSWDSIWEQYGERLRLVLDEDPGSHRVKNVELDCVRRGILRRPDTGRHYRYVSPSNLVRIVLNRFFGPPEGPGARLARYLPERRERVLEIARRVDATPALEQLARCELAEFDRLAMNNSPEELSRWVSAGASLYLAARVLPIEFSQGPATTLLGWDDERFQAATSVRSAVRQALAHVARRRIDAASFARVEAALFRLASFEFEPWANNASGVWRSLFLPGLSHTHRPWEERLSLLRARLSDASNPRARTLGIEALGDAVSHSEVGLGFTVEDQEDGPWPSPAPDRWAAMKAQAWAWSIAMAGDPVPQVAAAARRSITDKLRGAAAMGLLGLDAELDQSLAAAVRQWSRGEKTALTAAIAEIRIYEELTASLAAFVTSLEAALIPADFGERLSNQVGDWHPGPWPIDDPGRALLEQEEDRALADEAIATPELLLAELPWLTSHEAVRRASFLRQLGLRDRDAYFLPRIEEHARRVETPNLLAPYLIGRIQADDSVLDRWLERSADEPRWDRATAEVLVWSEAEDRRIERLTAVVRRTSIPAMVLLALRTRLERATVSAEVVLDLIEALSRSTRAVEAGLPLALHLLLRPGLPAQSHERLLAACEGLLRRVAEDGVQAPVVAHDWEDVVKAVAREGRAESAVDAVLRELLRARGPARADRVMRWLLEQGYTAQVWAEVRVMLEQGRGFELQWSLRRLQLTSAVGAPLVLDWVGADVSRAKIVARLSVPHAYPLDGVTRDLVLRFGPTGEVARELTRQAVATPRAVSSLRGFHEEQRERASRWSEDPDPRVRTWARGLVGELDRLIHGEKIEEESRRRYA